MFGRRDRIAERCVHDDDTARGRGLNIHVVDTNSSPSNNLEPLGCCEDLFRDLGGRSNGQAVVLADHALEFVP